MFTFTMNDNLPLRAAPIAQHDDKFRESLRKISIM